jgi:predicted acetyltransferase
MKRQVVENIIDRMITKSLTDHSNILETIYDLKNRSNNLFKTLERDNIDIDSFLPTIISENEGEIERLNISKKTVYILYYVDHTSKRIEDLKWMIEKSDKFKKYNNIQLFNLLKFKNKISKENSI